MKSIKPIAGIRRFSLGRVSVELTRLEHLPALWAILKDRPTFWAGNGGTSPEALPGFVEWWRQNALDGLTGFDNGRIVGGAFLDLIYPGLYATVHVFKERGYLNPRMISGIMKSGIPIFFERHNLEKLVGIVPINNRAVVRLAKAVGMSIRGTLRHHQKVNGQWQDYYWCEILKEEL